MLLKTAQDFFIYLLLYLFSSSTQDSLKLLWKKLKRQKQGKKTVAITMLERKRPGFYCLFFYRAVTTGAPHMGREQILEGWTWKSHSILFYILEPVWGKTLKQKPVERINQLIFELLNSNEHYGVCTSNMFLHEQQTPKAAWNISPVTPHWDYLHSRSVCSNPMRDPQGRSTGE